MNKSTQSNRTWRWIITALASLCLMQFQTISRADYSVQVGAFKDQARAARLVEKLQQQGFPAAAHVDDTGRSLLTRVKVGPYPDRTTAGQLRARLEAMGIPGFLVTSPSSGTTGAGTRELLAEPSSSEAATQDTGEDEAPDLPGDPAGIEDLFFSDTPGGEASGDKAETGKYTVRGFFNSKYAYTYQSPTHSSMFRNTLELQASDRLDENISWKISARGSYDAVFDINNFYSDRVEDNRRYEGAIHETYMDISSGDWDFRLGRQHIIWGEMVGLFFADVVSAKDTRQWVAEDFDMIRIPQWAARAEHFMGDFHAEAIWIPFMTYDEIGKPGDDFYPLGTEPPAGVRQVFRNDNQPTQELSNSAYGLRLSTLNAGWDISGFYYRSTDASPTFFRKFEAGPNPKIIFEPDHKKIHQFGGTLAKDFGNFLLKGEAIYTLDRRYIVDNLNDVDGVEKQNTLDYVIGLDYTTANGTDLNFQFFQRWYTDHDSDILYDEFENGASFYASKELTSTLEGELLFISSLNREDWMFRPQLTWDLTGNWWISAGADIFGGERKGLIGGRFDDSDRVYGNVRYAF
jgi:hypothetical protein